MDRIGFMQGRLSPMVDGKIQAFPWQHWQEEFPLAEKIGFQLIEWTLDHEKLAENPLITQGGRREIRQLTSATGVRVKSLTGDNFMQAPFYKAEGDQRNALIDEMKRVVDACADLSVQYIVIPLVDNGKIEKPEQADLLLEELTKLKPVLKSSGCK